MIVKMKTRKQLKTRNEILVRVEVNSGGGIYHEIDRKVLQLY
jgi:hypothetical protein